MGWFGNLRLKLLAVALALGMWGGVAYAENPTMRTSYNLSIDRPNVPTGLVVLGSLPTVQVTVVGSSQNLSNFDQHKLTLTANFASVHVGFNRVPIHVTSSDPNITVEYRDSIVAQVDQVGSADAQVTIQRLHQLPSGFHEVSAVVNPTRVTIHGPKSKLAGAQAIVQVDLADQQAVIDQGFRVIVTDSSGTKIDTAVATPAQVEVKVTIQPDALTETKPAGALIAGQPATGFFVKNIQVTPITVNATGLAGVLSTLQQIASDPVDISGATQDVVKTVNLRPPAGVSVTPNAVQVHVFIEKNPQVP